jgi:1-phosphatidylinositol phosphodiesterase
MKVSASFSLFAVPATLVVVLATGGACMVNQPVTPGTYGPLEYDTDRAGSDFHSFDLPEARPDLCLSYCQNQPQCLAFTYVKPGIQGPAPRCWLKSAIPQPAANGCCVSGVVRAQMAGGGPPPPMAPSPPPAPSGPPAAGPFENGTDRAGHDYRSFDVPEARPDICMGTCQNERQCLAFTYVQPGFQGPNARCWLKAAIPPPSPNACCISGVVRQAPAPTAPAGGLEPDTDRAGSDYRSFDLPQPAPEICQSACAAEPQCRAFTYVKPGVQGPSPRCWLKSSVPNPTSNACCTSGVRP